MEIGVYFRGGSLESLKLLLLKMLRNLFLTCVSFWYLPAALPAGWEGSQSISELC